MTDFYLGVNGLESEQHSKIEPTPFWTPLTCGCAFERNFPKPGSFFSAVKNERSFACRLTLSEWRNSCVRARARTQEKKQDRRDHFCPAANGKKGTWVRMTWKQEKKYLWWFLPSAVYHSRNKILFWMILSLLSYAFWWTIKESLCLAWRSWIRTQYHVKYATTTIKKAEEERFTRPSKEENSFFFFLVRMWNTLKKEKGFLKKSLQE